MSMLFQRKSGDILYKTVYSKKDAIKQLKYEKDIKKIECPDKTKMIIYTKPIIPKGFGYDEIVLGPIGSYIIYINELKTMLDINIKLNQKYLLYISNEYNNNGYIHQHITGIGKICHGDTLEDEKELLMENKDWYWVVKRYLELIKDWKYDEGLDSNYFVNGIIWAQIDYNKTLPKNKQIKNLKNKLWKGYIKLIKRKILKPKIKFKIGDKVKYDNFNKPGTVLSYILNDSFLEKYYKVNEYDISYSVDFDGEIDEFCKEDIKLIKT
jgi:hypothetical protein